MQEAELKSRLDAHFAPVMEDLERRAAVTDHLVDKDTYRILVCTLWVNLVLDPTEVGLDESHLEPLHDVLNRRVAAVLGDGQCLKACFRYLNGKSGEQAMKAARLTPEHRDMLLYFASMILDPEGHRRWMEQIRSRPGR